MDAHGVMETMVIEGPPVDWKGPEEGTTAATAAALAQGTEMAGGAVTDEIVNGLNNLRPVVFLEIGARLAQAVVHITLPSKGMATGFLIDTDVLLTNNHVFGSPDDAATAELRFNYQVDVNGNLIPAVQFACDPGSFFHTNRELDYALVRVKNEPGKAWGFLKLDPKASVAVGEDVVIIQHPSGQPKQIAIVDNEVAYEQAPVVQYLTDTMPGSSGSPVFDQNWKVVALHHSGGWFPQPAADSTHYRNEGILVSSLCADFPSWR